MYIMSKDITLIILLQCIVASLASLDGNFYPVLVLKPVLYYCNCHH